MTDDWLLIVDCLHTDDTDGHGGPQADGGEQVLINDERLMITDGVHTENTEGYGCPQADEVGEQQLSKIGRQLKEKIVCQRRTRRDTEDDDWWLIVDCLHTEHAEDTDNSKIWQGEFIEPT